MRAAALETRLAFLRLHERMADLESTDFKPGLVRGYRTAVTTVVCFGV